MQHEAGCGDARCLDVLGLQVRKERGWHACAWVWVRRERAERRAIRQDLRRLAGEERSRQEAAIVEVVKGAQVVASTLTGLLHRHLEVRNPSPSPNPGR